MGLFRKKQAASKQKIWQYELSFDMLHPELRVLAEKALDHYESALKTQEAHPMERLDTAINAYEKRANQRGTYLQRLLTGTASGAFTGAILNMKEPRDILWGAMTGAIVGHFAGMMSPTPLP